MGLFGGELPELSIQVERADGVYEAGRARLAGDRGLQRGGAGAARACRARALGAEVLPELRHPARAGRALLRQLRRAGVERLVNHRGAEHTEGAQSNSTLCAPSVPSVPLW